MKTTKYTTTLARLLDWQRFKNNKQNWLRFLFVVKVTALIQQNINILSTRYKHRSQLPAHLYQSVAWRLPSLVLIFCIFLVIYSKFRRNFIVQGFRSVRGGGRNLPFPTAFAVSWYYGTSGDIGDGVRSCVSQISRCLCVCVCVVLQWLWRGQWEPASCVTCCRLHQLNLTHWTAGAL